jgi:hypothetical protein
MIRDIARLEDALPRRELPDLDLRGEDCGFVIVKKLEEWDMT